MTSAWTKSLAKIQHNEDTIAAIATPIGEGAIAVIRLSGPNSLAAVDKIFRGKSKLIAADGYTAHFGKLVDACGAHVDDVIATVFRKPNSYTGEDSVEVSCHGGLFNTQRVFQAIIETGVRQAEPGEFTKRAFLNGKMDLSQAEAVADLIASRSESSHRSSLNQLEGRFSEEIRAIRADLLNLSSLIELELDFSEEGIDLIAKADLLSRISSLKLKLQAMSDSFRLGKIYRDGVNVVIVGKPNAGKSSLFNALLKENRAIVTELPGTTRDSLEENISIGEVLFRLSDTAGLRETKDIVESEGVDRAKKLIGQADLLLLVHDSTTGFEREEALHFLDGLNIPKRGILVHNKIDLVSHNGLKPEAVRYSDSEFQEVFVSVKTDEGMRELRSGLLNVSVDKPTDPSSSQVANERHHSALLKAIGSLEKSASSVEGGLSGEFISLEIHSAADSLAEITGEITTDDMLNNIFQHFCIGK